MRELSLVHGDLVSANPREMTDRFERACAIEWWSADGTHDRPIANTRTN
jgi:hypothetical protein